MKIPIEAPEYFPGSLHCPEGLISFFRRVWGPFIPHGLCLADIRALDPSLLSAIKYYRKTQTDWPEEFVLPTQRSKLAEAEKKFDQRALNELSHPQILAVGRKKYRDAKKAVKNSPGLKIG